MKKSNRECSWILTIIFSFLMLMYFTSCSTTYMRAFIRQDANVKDDFCDGFGDCLPSCPSGAITITEREAAAYEAQNWIR